MTRQISPATIALCVVATACFTGCQRPMGTASGPYAPAGSLSPGSSQPLIPFGPMTGATRVPPPPTGSSQVSNGYGSQPGAMSAANQNHNNPSGAAINSLASGAPLQSSASGARNALGGMPVIDLTAGMVNSGPPPAMYAPAVAPVAAAAVASAAPIGSGVAPAGWDSTQNISVPPSDLAARLRPLDPAENVQLVPFVGSQNDIPVASAPSVAMTQYRTETNASPAWQAVEPAPGQFSNSSHAFQQRSNPGDYAAQLPANALPSTAPVTPPSTAAAAPQNDALLWRNPTVAR